MTRYLRYMRIAFSATCLIACVLLIALWVRSYSFYYIMQGGNALGFFRADSAQGICKLLVATPQRPPNIALSLDAVNYDADMSLPIDVGFHHKTGDDFVTIGAPYWILVSPTSLVAAVPWIWPRRFSLRTLLIATTLVAVALGLIVWLKRTG